MSTTSDLKDVIVISAIVAGGFIVYKFIKKDGVISNIKSDLGFSNAQDTINRRLKTDVNSYPVNVSGPYAEAETGFYTPDQARTGSYKILESDIENLSPYERGLLARGTSIEEVTRIANKRAAFATALRTFVLKGFKMW